MKKECIVELSELKEYLLCREDLLRRSYDCIVYQTEDWLIKCKYINNQVWYTCWYLKEDYLIFEDCYDYSSTYITEVFDYCNSCIEDSFIYY